jgi:regulator of sigma E protease
MGLRIREFMFGLPGPRLFSFRWGETEYGATLLPFGGYVRFAGTESELQLEEDDEDKDTPPERKYDTQPKWKKAIIMVAGPTMNLIFPILLIALMLTIQGSPSVTKAPVIGEIVKGGPAYAAGFKQGDRITSVDGVKIKNWTELIAQLKDKPGKRVAITVKRDGTTLTLRPTLSNSKERPLGVAQDIKYKREPIHIAFYHGAVFTYDMLKLIVVTLYHFIIKDAGQLVSSSSGPVGIVYQTAKIAQTDFQLYVKILAFLSINIGILNLLPIPPLDGGRLAILGVEGIKRRPLNKKLVLAVNAAGMALLLLLMVYITIADLGRIFLRGFGAGGG